MMDPRSLATAEVLAQQFELGQQIFAETLEARRALDEISAVQKQLADAQNKQAAQTTRLMSAIAEAQSELGRILANKDNAPDLGPGLQNAYKNLASALRVVEGGDRAVPSQAIAVYKESSQQVKACIHEWTRFKQTDLLQLNQQLRLANIAAITVAEAEHEVDILTSQ